MEELLRSTNYPKQPAQHVCLLDAGASETLESKAPWTLKFLKKSKVKLVSAVSIFSLISKFLA